MGWLLARQADILELVLLGNLVTGMRMRQMLGQAACSSGKWGETSCGFQKAWQLFSQADLWLLLAWAGFGSKKGALESNPICSLGNSGLVVPSPACLSLPVLKMSLACGWITHVFFYSHVVGTNPFLLGQTTPELRAQ